MNLLALKLATFLAVGAAFAGAVALTATHGGGGLRPAFNAGTIDATPTAFVEKASTPVSDKPPPTFAPPPIPLPPTVIPGADKGGLFADGITNLPNVDSADWKTYTNSKYGYSFKYPSDWLLNVLDSPGGEGPHGEPAYPRQTTEVKNPAAQQGRKIPGQNCTEKANDCGGLPPTFMEFAVLIMPTRCVSSGNAIALDSKALSGRQGTRCVEENPNDKSRGASISVLLAGSDFIQVSMSRGNSVGPAMQAVLEAILSTFTLN